MLWTFLVMLLILVVAAAVVVYVAYPHRGEEVPGAPWLGEAMKRGVDSLPAPLDPPLEPMQEAKQEHIFDAEDDATRV